MNFENCHILDGKGSFKLNLMRSETTVRPIQATRPSLAGQFWICRECFSFGFCLNNTDYHVLVSVLSSEIRESPPRLREW